ncbi:hypothetical protein P7C71_g2001, partial [Lecanoromycetidae sp. Uapishka_2]
MAASTLPSTFKNGFRQPGKGTPWAVGAKEVIDDDEPHWVTPPSSEILSSDVHNTLGLNTIRSWPTMYDGTKSPHGLPEWWRPSSEVDVLICGEFQESGGHVDAHSVTAEEVLQQANKIFSPYKLKFAAPLSWFTVWKISERVARSFSSPDCRVHLAGDAAHIHSVMGAFGLNASIMDSANLAWKLGMCAQNQAKLSSLGPTYDSERRYHANRIIHVSGSYLRFICNSTFPLANFPHVKKEWPALPEPQKYQPAEGELQEDLRFLKTFFGNNGPFLLGIDADYPPSVINPQNETTAIAPRNGVRAPNPRVCLSSEQTGYLYDVLTGASRLHLVIFASDLQGPVRKRLRKLSAAMSDRSSFFQRFGALSRFNPVLVTKCVPHEAAILLASEGLDMLRETCTIVYDDRAPDEDAHTCYEVDHAKGAIVFVRPDLWVGTSVFIDQVDELSRYFEEWLVPINEEPKKVEGVNGANGHV